jgi:lysophospholipase L1-like esterase
MKRHHVLALFAVALGMVVSTAQGRAGESPASQQRPLTIVAFGDSITAPRGKLRVYPTLLEEELTARGRKVRVVNAGVGGNTTEQAKVRFETDVLAHKPDVAVVFFGANDAAVDVWKTPPATGPRVARERYEANLRQFCRRLKSHGAKTILVAPSPFRFTPKLKEMYGRPPYRPDDPDGFNVLLVEYAETVRRVAREEGAALADAYAAFQAYGRQPGRSVDNLLADGMHPNAAGQLLLADLLLPLLGEPPAKRSGPDVRLHPRAVDVTHDAPHETVLGCGLVRLDDGSVMHVYSAPSSYYSPPGSTYIACRITRDGGRTWLPEAKITTHADCQASHPSVIRARDGTIHVVYLAFKGWAWKDGNPTDKCHSDIWVIHSHDRGRTWTGRQRAFAGYSGATNGGCETRDGRLIFAFSHYVSQPGRLVSRAVVSADGGHSWQQSNALDIGGAGDHDGALEPAVIELKDGRVWMLIRTPRKQFWESFSTDGGLHWSAAVPTNIAATSAPGHLARLADGRLALAWNPAVCGRSALHLAISRDEGRTWGPSVVLARGRQVTYPAVLETEPGQFWIGYHDVHRPRSWNMPHARLLRIAECDAWPAGEGRY